MHVEVAKVIKYFFHFLTTYDLTSGSQDACHQRNASFNYLGVAKNYVGCGDVIHLAF
jgi:hypothetical protein